ELPRLRCTRRSNIDVLRYMGSAKSGGHSPVFTWLVAVVPGCNQRFGSRPAPRRAPPDPGHGDRASDRHRAQSTGAAAIVSARHRALSQDHLALGSRITGSADCPGGDCGARINDREPGRRRDGRYVGRGFLLARLFALERAYGALAGAGTAVCGASATLATSIVLPDYKGKETDIAFVVVAVNALSTLAMILYPLICVWLEFDPQTTGIM